MKKLIKVLVGAIAVWFVLMLGIGLVAKAVLSESKIQSALGRLESRVPVRITASGGGFSLAQWFQFQPAISVRDLTLANPPGFSSPALLKAGEVLFQIRLLPLLQRRVDVRLLEFDRPEVTIERDRNGRTNIETLLEAMNKSGAAEGAAGGGTPGQPQTALAVDSFRLKSGTVRYLEPGKGAPALTIRDIDIQLTDFSAGKACKILLASRLFSGKASVFGFEGHAGPPAAQSLPVDGELSLVLAPAEMPADMRKEYFGSLLGEPGNAARVSLKAALRGDMMGAVGGRGNLALSGLQIGKDSQSRLGLAGEIPLAVAVEKPLAGPRLLLKSENASLQLGQGRWKGSAKLLYDGEKMAGNSAGAIGGVRIEELVRAFTTSKDVVSGRAEIPAYSLSFAGKNAQQIRDSLSGQGRVSLEEGRVALFDLLGTIEKTANRLLSSADAPASGGTKFTRLESSVEIRDRQMLLPDLVLDNPASRVTGQGQMGFDGTLSFDLATNVTGELANRLGGKPDASGRPAYRVPVKVRGTLDSPKVYPDVAGMAKEKIVEKATGLLDSLFKKKPPK